MENEKFQELVLQQFDKVFKRLEAMQGDTDKLRQSQTRMEHEHGEKLSALFDGYKLISEKLDDHTEILKEHTTRLQRIEEKIVGHDVRIEILDQTKANKRRAK